MLKNYEGLLPSGAFLELCGTTYETLYHYEEIGILKPTLVKPNGRRYYSFSLFYIYIVITTLKRAGCSLLEIKMFLKNNNLSNNYDFLAKKKNDLDLELQRIIRAQQGINDAMKTIDKVIHTELDCPRLVECPEEYLIVQAYQLSRDKAPDKEELNRQMRECIMRVEEESEQLNDAERYLPGVIFLKETLEQGWFHESYCFRKRRNRTEEEHLWIKPAGTYLSLTCKSAIRNDTYVKIGEYLDYIKSSSYTTRGPLYLYILSFLYKDERWNNFIMELQTQVN